MTITQTKILFREHFILGTGTDPILFSFLNMKIWSDLNLIFKWWSGFQFTWNFHIIFSGNMKSDFWIADRFQVKSGTGQLCKFCKCVFSTLCSLEEILKFKTNKQKNTHLSSATWMNDQFSLHQLIYIKLWMHFGVPADFLLHLARSYIIKLTEHERSYIRNSGENIFWPV